MTAPADFDVPDIEGEAAQTVAPEAVESATADFDVPDIEAPGSAPGDVVPPPSPAAAQGPRNPEGDPNYNYFPGPKLPTINVSEGTKTRIKEFMDIPASRYLAKIGQRPLKYLNDFWQDTMATGSATGISAMAPNDALLSFMRGDDPVEIDRRFNRWRYIQAVAQGIADTSPLAMTAKLSGVPYSRKDADFIPLPGDMPAELSDLLTWDEAIFQSKMPLTQLLSVAGDPNSGYAIGGPISDLLKHSAAVFAEENKRDIQTVTVGEASKYAFEKMQSDWMHVLDNTKEARAGALAVLSTQVEGLDPRDVERELLVGVLNPVVVAGSASTTYLDVNVDPIVPVGEGIAATRVLEPITKLVGKVERAWKAVQTGKKLTPEEAGLALHLLDWEEYVRNVGRQEGELPRGINNEFELAALGDFREKIQSLAENSDLTYEQFKAALYERSGQHYYKGPASHKPPPSPGAPPPAKEPIITPPPTTTPPKEPIITPPPEGLAKTPAEMEAPILSPPPEPPESGIGQIISEGISRQRAAEDRELALIRESIRKTGEPPPGREFGIRVSARAGILGRRQFVEYMGSLRKELREAGNDFQRISGVGSDLREVADLLEGGYENWAKELRALDKEVLQAFEDSWMRAAAVNELEMDTPAPMTDTGQGIRDLETRGPEPAAPKAAEVEAPPKKRAHLAGGRPKSRQETAKQKAKRAVKEGTAGKKALTQEEVQEISRRMAFMRNAMKAMEPGLDLEHAALTINILNQALENRGKLPASLRRAVDEILNKPRFQGPGAASVEEFKKLQDERRMYLGEKFLRAEQMIREGETPLYHHTTVENVFGMLHEHLNAENMVVKQTAIGGILATGEEGMKTPAYFSRYDLSKYPADLRKDPILGEPNWYAGWARQEGTDALGRKGPLNVRIVTTREELTRQGFKPEIGDWHAAAEEISYAPKKKMEKWGNRKQPLLAAAPNKIPLKSILKIELDPSALRYGSGVEPDVDHLNNLLQLIKLAEDNGIPTVIRPLFQQTGVQEFRPILPPVMEKSLYKTLSGPDEATNISLGLAKVANETSTVEEAAAAMRNLKTSFDSRTGGAVLDAGIELEGKTAAQAGEELLEAQVPGISDSGKNFLPRFPVRKLQDPITDPARLLMAPNPMMSAGPEKLTYAGYPIRPIAMGPDASAFATLFAGPQYVLDNKKIPLAKGLFDLQRWARYYGDKEMGNYVDAAIGVADIARKGAKNPKLSERLFDAVNAEIYEGFNASEIEAIRKYRTYLQEFVSKNDKKFFSKVGNSAEEFLTARRKWERMGLLEKAGFLAWDPDDFWTKGYMKNWVADEIPPELVGEKINSVIMQHAFPGLKGHKDIVSSIRVLGPGVIREKIWRRTWKDMAQTAESLPPRMRGYVHEWIQAQRGVKSRLHQITEGAKKGARFRVGDINISPAEELAGMVLTGFYRGALYGNVGYYLTNFLGQGVANAYAAHGQHGPFAPFQGIARHFQRAFDGVNQEQILGGWNSILGKEIPKTPISAELMGNPAWRNMRKFLDWVENTSGPTQSEFINRSVGMHIGLQQAVDNYNFRNGTNVTWKEVLDGKMGEGVMDRMMHEALQVSDNINFIYGMDGSNPFIRNTVGRTPVAAVGQFLSFIPKETEFFGKALKEGDPGVIIRYLTVTGFMSNLAAKSLGIDLTSSFFFGSVAANLGGGFLSPSIQLLKQAMQSITEADPVKRDNIVKEMSRTASMLFHPGMLQRQKTEHFFRQLRAGRLLSTDGPPWDMIATWGPEALQQHGPIFGPNGRVDWTHTQIENEVGRILASETPGRFMGMPMVSDRQERMIYKAAMRIQGNWRLKAKQTVDEIMIGLQNGKTFEDPKIQELIQKMSEDGIPIDKMLQAGILESSIPKMMRWFMDQNNMYKGNFYDYLKTLYPEVFDNVPVMPYNMFGPKNNPADSIEYNSTTNESELDVPDIEGVQQTLPVGEVP